MEIILCQRGTGAKVPESPKQLLQLNMPTVDLKYPVKGIPRVELIHGHTLMVVFDVDDESDETPARKPPAVVLEAPQAVGDDEKLREP